VQEHEENMQTILKGTQEKLAGNIKDAEHRKDLPLEAVVVTITSSTVFWGSPLELKRFKKKWISDQSKTLGGQMRYHLQKLGRAVGLKKLDNGKGEIWTIWDTADVHMASHASERVKKNATPENVKRHEQSIEASKEFELGAEDPKG